MDIGFIGVGAAINSTSSSTSFIIDDQLLIETPPEINIKIRKFNYDYQKIKYIIISHLHHDHYFGLPLFLIEYLLHPKKTPLTIYGPLKLEENLIELFKMSYEELDYEKVIKKSNVNFQTMSENTKIQFDNYIIKFHKVVHGNMDTYGVTIMDPKGLKILYSADTELFPQLINLLSQTNIGIFDATTKDKPIPGHMCYKTLLDLSKNQSYYLFAIHRSIYEIQNKNPRIILPKDGEKYKLEEKCPPTLI